MPNKKIMVLAILLVSLLAVSAVSAAENVTGDVVGVEKTTDDVVSVNNNADIVVVDNKNISEISSDGGDDFISDFEDEENDDYIYLNIPSTVNKLYGDEYFLDYEFSGDYQGNVTIVVDNQVIYQSKVDNGYVELTTDLIYDLDCGTHSVLFSFVATGGSHDSFNESGEFELTYPFRAYIYDEYEDYLIYGDDLFVNIRTPTNEGNISYSVNGKSYLLKADELVSDDEYGYGVIIPFSDLKIGENSLIFTYVNPKFPNKTCILNVDLQPRIILSDDTIIWSEETDVSLILPKTAKGNLEVYYDGELYKSTPVKNGVANITLKNLTLGEHEILAKYTGDDFDVEELTETYFEVIPNITMPRKVWRQGDYSLVFELPSVYNGNLTLTMAGESKTVNVVKGKGEIRLFNLDKAQHEEYDDGYDYIIAKISYKDDNGYEYQIRRYLTVSDNDPTIIFDLDTNNEVIRSYGYYYYELCAFRGNFNLPEDASGKYEVYIDEKLAYSGYVDEYDNFFEINVDNLTLGKHTAVLKYYGNSYYLPSSANATFEVIDIKIVIPDSVVINGEGSSDVWVYFNKYVSGNVTIWVDGNIVKEFIITPAYYGESIWYDLTDLDLKTHKIEVKYTGDSQHEAIIQTANVDIDYTIGINYEEFVYALENISVELPDDATNNITATIDGKSAIVNKDEFGNFEVDLSNLKPGDYELKVTYLGDSKYPALTVTKQISVYPEIQFSYDKYNSDENYVYLKLPNDAKGNLVVSLDYEVYQTVKLSNGVANISLKSLDLGYYEMSARYDGKDYYVRSIYDEFEISPNVIVNEYYLINETGFVYVEIPSDAKGSLIIEVDGNQYKTAKFLDGKVNVTIQGLKLGSHKISFTYDGRDYDVSGDYDFYISPLDEYYPYHVGETMFIRLPSDAKGNLIIMLDGKQIDKVKLNNGYANMTIPQLSNGWDNNLTFIYDGDDYGPYNIWDGNYLIKAKASIFNGISQSKVQLYPIGGATIHTNISLARSDDVIVELPEKFNGEFTVTLDDVFLTKGQFSDGMATFSLSNAKLGLQHLYIDYEYAAGKHDFISFYVNIKESPNLTVSVNVDSNQNAIVEVSADSKINCETIVSVNGTNYTVNLTNGKGNVHVDNLKPGSYSVKAIFNGNNDFGHQGVECSFAVNSTGESTSENSTVEPVITASNVNVVYSAGSYYTITVYGVDGKLANDAKIVITVKGKTFKTLTTKNGVGQFKVTNVPGSYKMTITALGKSITRTLTVKHLVTLKLVSVKKSAKKLVLTASLGKINKKYLKNKKITFKFNGKKYVAKTDKKGVAKVTIKSNVLKKLKVGKKVVYQATYGKDTVKNTVKVKK